MDKETIIKGCENWVNNHKGENLLLAYSSVVELLVVLKEQETSNTGKARIFQCEKCGYGFNDIFLTDEHNYDIEPRYCPNCGKQVK